MSGFWRQSYGAYVKNLKRMLSSKSAMALIFLGPFMVLLIIQGVYHDTHQVDLQIGIVAGDGSPEIASFRDRLSEEGLSVLDFPTNTTCVERLKQGYVDVCVQLDYGSVREATFYVDYSKMNLVNTVSQLLTGKVEDQAKDLRVLFLKEMNDRVLESSEMVASVRERMDSSMDAINPQARFASIRRTLSSSGSASGAETSLDLMEGKVQRSHEEVSSSLDGFEEDVKDVRARAASELAQVKSLRSYADQCDGNIPSLDPEAISEMDPDVLQSKAEELGKCKCVQYYDTNLAKVQADLNAAVAAADSTLERIGETRKRNDDFFSQAMMTTTMQRQQLDSLSSGKDEILQQMQEFDDEFQLQMGVIEGMLDEVEEKTARLSSQVSLSADEINDPIVVNVRPVSAARDFIVYFFPLVFFLIVMFIALLFSATFMYGERMSLAVQRNLISPLRSSSHLLGMVGSLMTVMLAQACIIMILSDISFGFGLGLVMFVKMFLVLAVTILFFVLVGIMIGLLFRSQLVVTLIAIASSMIFFLYSSIIRPEELMMPVIRAIIHVNPYAISAAATSKIILFDMGVGLFIGSLVLVILECLVVLGIVVLLLRRERSRL